MNQLYTSVGISKQAVHKYATEQSDYEEKIANLLLEVDQLRRDHPGCGVEKMYYALNPGFIGRDKFIAIMMQLGYRLKRKPNYKKTTIASKVYYPNLIQGLSLQAPCGVWQSDITYIRIGERYYYAVFIIDVYTKVIVGYTVSDHMRATANVKAMQKALQQYKAPQIHHSDRGSQYIYKEYVDLLKQNHCLISMGLCAQDNAYAERINRTIKEEYLDHWKPQSYHQLRRQVDQAVENYNSKRPHKNLGRLTPRSFLRFCHMTKPQERPELIIYKEQIIN